MNKDIVKAIKKEIKDKAYVPGDWVGVSDVQVVRLSDVLWIIDKYTEE